MTSFVKKYTTISPNPWQWAILLFPVIIDIIDWYLFEDINAIILQQFQHPSITTMVSILVTYVLFILAMFLANFLEQDYQISPFSFIDSAESKIPGQKKINNRSKITLSSALFLYPTTGFGIIMLVLLNHAAGLTGDTMVVSENSFAVIFFIGFILFSLHLVLFANPPKPRLQANSAGYFFLLSFVVLVAAYTINYSVAAWQYLFGDLTREIKPNRPGRMLDFIFAYPLFLSFFSSPRLMFLGRTFSWYSLATALALMAWFVWKSLDYVFII